MEQTKQIFVCWWGVIISLRGDSIWSAHGVPGGPCTGHRGRGVIDGGGVGGDGLSMDFTVDRQRDRQRDRQTDRETERQTERQRDRHNTYLKHLCNVGLS